MVERGPEIVVSGLTPAAPVRFAPGTVTLIAGPNGAGKTHLLEQLAGLRPPGGLAIVWGNRPLWERSRWPGGRPRPRRDVLFQYSYAGQDAEAMLVARTVKDELHDALRPYRLSGSERSRRIAAALAAFGWGPADLARDPFRMSGGERRRVALMTALAPPVPWLLLDEPTVGLDAPGQRQLAAALRRVREEGRGIVLVSHDWDWALPLADRLLIMGGIGRPAVWCERRTLLERPELLEAAETEPPAWLPLARAAWMRGVPEPDVWDPVSLARYPEAWQVAADTAPPIVRETAEKAGREAGSGQGAEAEGRDRVARRTAETGDAGGRLARFDPRALLLAYALLSIGLIQMREWRHLLTGALAVAAVALWGRLPLARWKGWIAGWLILSLVMALFVGWSAGLAGGGADAFAGFETARFDRTLRVFVGTLLAMLPGAGLLAAMSPLRLRGALERLFRIRGRTPGRVRWLALTIALMLRFVPVLLREWERFGRLTLARGKIVRSTPAAWVRRLRDQSVPFLLAMFRLADETAAALESRGAGRRLPADGRAWGADWRKDDMALVIGAALLSAVLLGVSRM